MNGLARRFPAIRLVAAGGAVAIALSFLCLATASAQTERVEREVAGFGADNSYAVLNALHEATFQICGVRVQSSLSQQSPLVVAYGGDKIESEVIDWVNRRIQADTANPNCTIDGYEVLELSGDGSGVRALLRVSYSVYKVPGAPMNRRTIAVLEFPMEEVHLYGVGGGREQRVDGRVVRVGIDVDFKNVRNLEAEFTGKVEELLTQGRRFGVLDRKRQDVYDAERTLLQSSDAGPGERARLGQVLGADYMLYGTIDRVVVEDQSRTIEITGERIDRLVGAAEVRFTVLATATRQVKWSSSIALDQEFRTNLHPERAAASVLHDVAATLVDELTENIYPPKVTQVLAPGQFIVNRGGSTVAPGDLFEVFSQGELLIDPDTGEPLDRIELSVGIAQIVDVKTKYSVAELISGDAALARGMVLRRRSLDAGAGVRQIDQRQRVEDEDGDGLPDYLNRL